MSHYNSLACNNFQLVSLVLRCVKLHLSGTVYILSMMLLGEELQPLSYSDTYLIKIYQMLQLSHLF